MLRVRVQLHSEIRQNSKKKFQGDIRCKYSDDRNRIKATERDTPAGLDE